ncbi:MAG: hypothetical protein D6738_06355 [Acidobacteria bacterium]|nr:MAG: hypothetical protein D6738_06355 [Acidobacteriota bacterium]
MSRRAPSRPTLLAIVAIAVAGSAAAPATAGPLLSGRVVDQAGRPVAGARVELLRPAAPYDEALRVLAGPDAPGASAIAAAPSGKDGTYAVEAPDAGPFVARVRAEGFATLELPVEPLAGDRLLPTATLERAESVVVSVVDRSGAPVAGAWVRLEVERARRRIFGRRSDWRPHPESAWTGPDGRAALARPAGTRVSVVAALPDGPWVRVGPLRGTGLRVAVDAGPHVRVQVVDAAGAPAARAVLLAGGEERGESIPLGVTAEDGTTELTVPAGGGPFSLIALDARGVTARRRIRPADPESAAAGGKRPAPPLTLALPRAARLVGRVIDASTGAPIAGAAVWPGEDLTRVARTGGDGRFVIEGLEPGGVRLNAVAAGYVRPGNETLATVGDERLPPPTIALHPGAFVAGRVVDADGRPVAGALLTATPRPVPGSFRITIGAARSPDNRAESGADGGFRLGPLDPRASWDLIATAPGFARTRRPAPRLEPRRTTDGMRVVLERGARIAGRVLDDQGRPVAGALVRATVEPRGERRRGMVVRMLAGAAPEPLETISATDGTFVVDSLSPGRWRLSIAASGFARATVEGLDVAEGDAVVEAGDVVLAPGETLAGVVLDETGAPVDGAEVRVLEPERGPRRGAMRLFGGGERTPPDAVTGPDGWFTVADLAPGRPVDVEVTRRGYVDASLPRVGIPRPEPLEIRLVAASTVSGRVLDPEGRPVADATVMLERRRAVMRGGFSAVIQMAEDTRTDQDGAFRFEGVEPGKIQLSAQATDFRSATREFTVTEGEDLEDVVLPLEPAATVTGHVTRPDGSPAIGVWVGPVAGGETVRGPARTAAPTDGDGAFVLSGLEPGPVSLEARDDAGLRTVRDVDLEPGLNRVDFVLEGGQRVTGRVVDTTGAPVPGVHVRLSPAGRGWGGPSATSDAAGRFAIDDVPPGSWEARAGGDGLPSSEPVPLEVGEEAPPAGIELVIPQGGTIAGAITGLDETALGRVELFAAPEDGGDWRSPLVARDGSFRIENATPGPWTLRATEPESGRVARARVEVAPGAEARADLVFEAGLALTGQVLHAGRPVADAMAFLRGLDVSGGARSTTDAEGRFRFEGLAAGSYEVGINDLRTGLAWSETVALDADRDVTIEIPTGVIAGRCVDADSGEPLSGAAVRAEPLSAGEGSRNVVSGRTDLDGRFEIGPVGEGTYRVTANLDGYAAESTLVDVSPGGDARETTLRLTPTAGLTLAVTGPTGAPPSEVLVDVLDPAGRSIVSGRWGTGESGRVRLGSVPAGAVAVVVGAFGTATTRLDAQAPGGPIPIALGAPTVLEVEVPELADSSASAEMTLRDASGRPWYRLTWSGSARPGWRVAGGRARAETLPAGSWQVEVTAADGRRWSGSAVTTPAAPARVVLGGS